LTLKVVRLIRTIGKLKRNDINNTQCKVIYSAVRILKRQFIKRCCFDLPTDAESEE
jgi:hypothetical protein